MLSSSIIDIPQHLHNSKLYAAVLEEIKKIEINCKCSQDIDSTIVILSCCLKNNLVLSNIDDYEHLLGTLHHWQLEVSCDDPVMNSIFIFIVNWSDRNRVNEITKRYKSNLVMPEILWRLLDIPYGDHREEMKLAMEFGNMSAIEYLHGTLNVAFDVLDGITVIKNKYTNCFNYLRDNSCGWDKRSIFTALEANDHDTLLYLISSNCDLSFGVDCLIREESLHLPFLSVVAYYGWIDCIQVALKRGYLLDLTATEMAAAGGQLHCLIYLHGIGCPWDESTCHRAAAADHLECLKYAHECGCPWKTDTVTTASHAGSLRCLQYAHQQGLPLAKASTYAAAKKGRLECLRYLHEHGCAWDSVTCLSAAWYGQLDILVYCHENGCKWDSQTCEKACVKGSLSCLKYAHEHGCPWDQKTIEWALHKKENGSYNAEEIRIAWSKQDCINYALENDCPIPNEIRIKFRAAVETETPVLTFCGALARYGLVKCLQSARLRGCEWSSEVCAQAALMGQYELLVYAHENMCPWDRTTSENAAIGGHIECLTYSLENGCPWTEQVCINAANGGHNDCFEYAIHYGKMREEYKSSAIILEARLNVESKSTIE